MRRAMVVIGLLSCIGSAAWSQELICIVDGVRVASSVCTGFGVPPARVTVDQIESMEIVKGRAAEDLYGRGAAGGVISITTKGGAGVPSPFDDPLARHLFPPELVMAHQQAIGLTDRQRAAIQLAIRDAQAKFVDLQFTMSAEVETLQRLLESGSVDEAKVLEQVDRVLAVERQVKHAQLALMVRIKNQLTPQQQAELGRRRRQ